MCSIIYKKGKEIDTVEGLLKEYPDIYLSLSRGKNHASLDCCLCQIDIEETFYRNNIKYKVVGCDEYEIIED